jgi:hypothetical protein
LIEGFLLSCKVERLTLSRQLWPLPGAKRLKGAKL